MDRLAQSPLRLSAGFGGTKRSAALKYRVPAEHGTNGKHLASRKRRLLQPLTPSLTATATSVAPPPPTDKARVEFEAALRRRDFEQVMWLIESGDVPATYETSGGETALLAAIGARHEDAFRLILQCHGVSIDCPNRHGYTPLMKAIAAAAPFAEASSSTSPPSATLDTGRSVTFAASNNLQDDEEDGDAFDNRMVACVLARAPNLHARDAAGQTAFDWALRTRNRAALAMLHAHQRRARARHADFADGEKRRRECVALLQRHDALALEMEALLRVPLLQEAALLHLLRRPAAAELTREALADALADLAALSGDEGVGSNELFIRDVYIGRETRDGWTPLTKAAASGFTDAVELLLALGADANHETARHKHTALTWASCCGHEGVVLALLRRADVDVDRKTREGKTALIHAAANARLAVVRHLLRELHARCVARAGGKQTFHHNEDAVRARRPSSWGRRPRTSSAGATTSRRKPGTEEWHELFLATVQAQDASGRDAMAFAVDSLEVRAALADALRQAQDHAAYVAEHRARTEPAACKYAAEGCDFEAPRDLLPTHELHECAKRRVACVRCGAEDIRFEARETHDRAGCPERLVACPHRARGCVALLCVREAEAHARDHCRKRPVACRLGCGAAEDLSFDQREIHEATQCPLRLVSCPDACGAAPFRANERGVHKRKLCVKRLVVCTGGTEATGGCGQPVRVDEMHWHVTALCAARRVACKWAGHGCDARLGGSAEARRHHEDAECPFRLVACRHGSDSACGATDMLGCFVEQHYAWQCPAERVACPNACGVGELPRHAMDAHVLSDAGDCAARRVRCRLDLCGKTLRLYDVDNGEGDVKEEDKEKESETHKSGTPVDGATQPTRVAMRALQVQLARLTAFFDRLQQRHAQDDRDEDQDGEDQRADSDQEEEAPFWRVRAARAQLLAWLAPQLSALQDELARVEVAKHAASERVRVLSFDAATGRHLLESRRDARAHWLDLCGREFDVEGIACDQGAVDASAASAAAARFGCGLLVASERTAHEVGACEQRLVACPLACGQRLAAQGVARHLAARCNHRNAACRLGCGAVLPFLALGDHEQSQCPRRAATCEHCHAAVATHAALAKHVASACDRVPRRCRLGCGTLVAAADSATHETAECAKRLVACALCEQSVFAAELAVHEASECALRVVGPCDAGCGATLRANERTHHLLVDCALREVPCALCHAPVARRAMREHQAQLCAMRTVLCRRGCGEHVRANERERHEDDACARRVVFCSNRCGEQLPLVALPGHLAGQCAMRVVACPAGCGDQLFAYQLVTHAVRCRQRLCACGAGASACARPIRLWVCQRALVACQAHGETALLWAIKQRDEELVAYFVQAVDAEQLDAEGAGGFAPLAMAASLGALETAKTLLRAGADVNAESSRGRTPLSEATLARDPAMVALLLAHRARVLHANRHGQRVLAVAETLADGGEQDERAARVLALLRDQQALETDQRALFRAIAASDYAFVAALLQHAGNDRDVPESELEKQLEDAKDAKDAVARDVDESAALLSESIADTEAKAAQAARLRETAANCATQLSVVAEHHEASLAASNALESELLTQIGALTALDIAALLNAAAPPSPEWLVVMKSLCLFCGAMPRGRRVASEYADLEWWRTAQALLMDRALLRKLRGYRQQTVTPDVMAKARRECLRTPAFLAVSPEESAARTTATATATATATPPATTITVSDPTATITVSAPAAATKTATAPAAAITTATAPAATATPSSPTRRGALAGDVVWRLAAWVRGVETEYKHQTERAALADKTRRLAASLGAHEVALAATAFESQVAARSLPARQQEVQAAQARLTAAERALEAATQRLRASKLVRFAALNGHSALSFACAVGNEAMVHMLLPHGARVGASREDREASAALIQLAFRAARFRRQREQDETQSRSDAAVAALVRSVAQTFLLGHYRRRRRLARLTHRVALHEAVYNGHAAVAALLLAQDDVSVWQRTHVFPTRVTPGTTDRVRGDPASERELRRRGGWALVPLTAEPAHSTEDEDDNDHDECIDPRALETRLAPLSLVETLRHAVHAFDCDTFLRDRGGWTSVHGETRYSETVRLVETTLARARERRAAQRHEILARKSAVRKTAERAALHAQLETAILARAFRDVAKLLDEGAFADYATTSGGLTALAAACGDDALFVANDDGVHVRASAFLLDRASNRPAVDFESATGATALAAAAAHGALLCAQELVDRGADVNYATRARGETALMVAARSAQVEFVAYLLRHEAIDVFIKDAKGKTALGHAREAGSHDAQALLAAAMSGGLQRTRVFASASALYGVCKWGCGFLAPAEDHIVGYSGVPETLHPLATHERDACPKRLVACPNACGTATLWAEQVERHTRRECARRLLTCAQPKCGARVEAQQLAAHERDDCDWRVVGCACGERMAHAKHVVHAANACPQRLVACPNACEDGKSTGVRMLRVCELKQHERAECALRRVRCRNGCPANALLARDREAHETQRCPLRRVQCKWRCGEPNVLAHMQQHHETSECLQRELACSLQCGATVEFLALERHTSELCARRLALCELGCGRKVPLHVMARHVASECARRAVACPQQCGAQLPEGELAAHAAAQCSQRLVTCAQCGAAGGQLRHAQLALHRETQCRMRVVRCRFQCYAAAPLRAHAQAQHEQFECALRPVVCALGCGAVVVAHTAKRHEKSCDMRVITCAACGAEMREKDRTEHELRYCERGGGTGGKGGTKSPLQRGRG